MRTLVLALAAAALVAPGAAQEATGAKLSGAALIDHWIKAKWNDAGLRPAKRSDDAEFLRRAYLDIVGRIPSLDEAEKFLADKAMYKRPKLVETLLRDPRYAEHWADLWSGILVGFDNDNREQGVRMKATADLRGMLAKNLPHDEFARKVITAQGAVAQRGTMPVEESGLAGYLYNIQREAGRDFPMALAGKLTRAFMGVQIQCAQCHDHPFDKWTQEEFYGMASFFTEVSARRVPIGADMMDRRKKEEKKEEKKGEAPKKPELPKVQQQPEYYFQISDNPRRGGRGADLSIPDSKTSAGPIKASFIDTGKGAVAGELRRVTFAKYVTGKENLQFAKMSVNRMWAHFTGAGIVNPVDDFNGKNKPTHPEMLEALAKDYIEHQYDNHWLIKAITSSEAYHLSSRVAGKERDPQAEKYFAIARVRAMAPEQILRSVMEAVDFGEGPMARMRARDGKEGKGPMAGMDRKDMALFGMLSQFRSNFADDEGNEVTEFAGTIPSALLMMNGGLTNGGSPFGGFGGRLDPKMAARLADRMGAMSPLGDLVKKHPGPDAAIRAIYLSVLTRTPSDKETKRWKEHVTRSPGLSGYEDLQWTLLNTSEFLFNH